MRKRWLIYIIIGLCFGIVDWYYLDWLASLLAGFGDNERLLDSAVLRLLITATFIVLNYGIWLVPVIPAAVYEMKQSGSLRKVALSAVVVWIAALLGYYAYYTFLLMFVGLPQLDFMLFSNHQSPTYWADWRPPFQRIILDQFIEWVVIAVIGGGIIGALSAFVFNRIVKRRSLSPPASASS